MSSKKEFYHLEKIEIASQIRTFFLSNKKRWVSQKELRGKNRLWQTVFNELVKQNFIKVKKSIPFDKYKWNDSWKEDESKPDYVA